MGNKGTIDKVKDDDPTTSKMFSSNYHNPLCFATGAINNPDTLSQSQMFKAHDRDLFLKAQLEEIIGLEEAKVFDFHRIQSLPNG